MSRIIILLISVLLVGQFSCSNGLNALFTDGAFSSTADYSEYASQFRYLGLLYSNELNSEITDVVLTGEIYDSHTDRILKALNITMRFPFDENRPGKSSSAADLWSSIWQESMPGIIEDLILDFGLTLSSDGIADGLPQLMASDEGNQFIIDYLNATSGTTQTLVDYILNSDPSFRDEISTLLAGSDMFRMAQPGQDFYSYFAGLSIGISISQSLAMIHSTAYNDSSLYSQFTCIRDVLVPLENQLLSIQLALNELEQDIDHIDDKIAVLQELDIKTMLEDSREHISDARIMMETLHSHLRTLISENDKREYLKQVLITGDSFSRIFTGAFAEAGAAQAVVQNYNLADDITSNVELQRWDDRDCTFLCLGCVPLCNGSSPNQCRACLLACDQCNSNPITELEPTSYIVKSPQWYTPWLLQDIALLKRLSLERLSLLSSVYNGLELLLYRARFAANDLDKILKIKAGLNNFTRHLNSYISSDFVLDKGVAHHCRLVSYDEDGTPVSHGEDPAIGNTELHNALISFVEESDYYNDYLVAAYSLVLSWEIQLRAHIAAGETGR